MKKLTSLFVALLITIAAQAQLTKADIFGSEEIIWLGLDFSQVHFIGEAAQWQDVGDINNDELRDKYFVAWNDLFINEQSKYDVAGAVGRSEVSYATEVTEKSNNKLTRDFFSSNGNDYQLLDEQKVQKLVSKYNFQGKSGVGMMFFVEGMSKGKAEASMWVAFVDMKAKKVLLTKRLEEKSGGFGFRNYWAKPFYLALKDMKKGAFKKWKKG